MQRSLTSLALSVAAIGLVAVSWAQQPAQPPAPPAPSVEQETKVSDADLDTFAEIYVDLQKTAGKFEEEVAEAETEQQAQELQGKMRQESLDKIAEHGWTPEMYNRIADAINADPELIDRTIALIDERS